MNFLHKPVLSFTLLVVGTIVVSTPIFATEKSGVSIKAVLTSAPMTLADFVAKAKVKGTTSLVAKTGTDVPSAKPMIPVTDLLNAKPIVLAEFVELKEPSKAKATLPEQIVVKEVKTQVAEPIPTALTVDTPSAQLLAKVVVAAKAPAPSAPRSVIAITEVSGTYKITPERLTFDDIGNTAEIRITGAMPSDLALFVRDIHIAEFNKLDLSLTSKTAGATELYVVAGGRMNIIPVVVKSSAKPFDLKVPDNLVSLDGIVHGGAASALYPGVDAPAKTESAVALTDLPTTVDTDYVQADLSSFYNEKAAAQYETVKIKIVDDRTPLDLSTEGRAYPASIVQINVVGTDYVTQTDATGLAQIREVPKNSRMLIKITDPHGVYRPAVAEIASGRSVQTVRLMRNFSFDGFSEIVQSSPHAALGSACLRIVDAETRAPSVGMKVEIDARGEGPFYFNQYGFIDRSLTQTGTDGRVCIFNVDPGPVAISMFDGETLMATVSKAVFAGYHLEDSVSIGVEKTLRLQLASLAPAAVQLNADVETANRYLPVEYAEVTPFGHADPMIFLGPGLVESKLPVASFDGKTRFAVQAADFEPSIYTVPTNTRQTPIIPLVPRGFVEDMAVYAQVTYEPSMGSVFVEYNHHESVQAESVKIKLVDHDNNSRGEGWYFSDLPLTKALFFNVPAGIYQVQANTSDGYWLTSQVVYVYDENMTYIRLGGAIKSNKK
jgi:hypothetical protein